MMGRFVKSFGSLVLTLVVLSSASAAPPTAQQRASARAVATALTKAGNLYRSKKFSEAAAALKEAQDSLAQIEDEPGGELAALIAPLEKQLAKTRDLLVAEGIEIPAAKPRPKGKPAASFTKQVAPLLVARCAGCHIQRSRGEFNMGSYVALSRGSKSGTVIMPGDARGSRIIEVLTSGDMPRAGGKLSPEEVALIAAWINAGASFDGPDSAAPLTSVAAPKTKDEPRTKIEVVAATGKEPVQFARDLGKILLDQCTECHGEQNPRNNFSVISFDRLLRGGDSGLVLVPGKPAESLLVKKLRGLAGKRMPLDEPPLPEEAIARIEQWIELGAKFDGSDPAAPLDEMVAVAVAHNSSHEELSQARAQLAAKNWRLMMPDGPDHHEETPNLVLYGSALPEVLSDVARAADEQVVKLRKLFKVPAEQPLVKGRLTVFAFDQRYDYGEVGTMLEHREIPSAWRGHWRYTGADAYACVLLSSDGQASAGLLAQQIAGAYIASLGKIPHWFAEGTGRAVAAKFDPKDPRVKFWDDQIARILHATDKPDGFLSGRLPPEDGDILSYSYVKFLMTSGSRFTPLIAALQQGTPFEAAFAKSFGGTPSQIAATWAGKAGKRGR
jgi:mono/diheme cytochrome c family protein